MNMTARVVEMADQLIANPRLNLVTKKFPEMMQFVKSKRNWWEYYVHTIAAVDQYKTVLEFLDLTRVEKVEAQAATGFSKAIEIGDMAVFLSALIVRGTMSDAYSDSNQKKEVEEEAVAHASYMFEELPKTGVSVDKARRGVFKKIIYNFQTQLQPKLPPDANERQARLIYASSYQAPDFCFLVRADRGYDITDTGLPREWGCVYYKNGHTPDYLNGVRDVTLEQMKKLGAVYVGEFGNEGARILHDYWELLAPGMLDDLQEILHY